MERIRWNYVSPKVINGIYGMIWARIKIYALIYLEKAYDMVPRNLIWWVLDKRSAPGGYIKIIKHMYEGLVRSMRTTSMTIGLYRGSTLSLYLFTWIMDELIAHV